MQSDLWQRRIGWSCLVAIVLFCGALAQQKHATADDADPNAQSDDLGHLLAQAPDNAFQASPEFQHQMEAFHLQMHGLDSETGKYWIGVECREAQPELRDQLGLKDGEGLVVIHVAEDGPASKAGIKQHDVIISVGDAKLSHPADLIKAVNAADGKEISLKIIRGGKEQTVAVTPAERPQADSRIIARPGPGFMFPGGGPHVDLPDNVTVTIVHHGKEPGKVAVTRGDEKWEMTDQELNKLPDDLRPLVERMIGVGPWALPLSGGFNMPGMRIEGMPMGPPGFNPPPRDGNGPPRDGNGPPPGDGNGPPRRDGNRPPDDGNPPPRDGGPPRQDGPPGLPPRAQPGGPDARNEFAPPGAPEDRAGRRGQMMPLGQMLPELMQRLDQLDRRLDMIQQELQRMPEGAPGGMPRMRPRGPDDTMPRLQPRGPEDGRNGPPPGGPGRQAPPNEQ